MRQPGRLRCPVVLLQFFLLCKLQSTAAALNLEDDFPNFEADSTAGEIRFHEWLGKSWGILFSHPGDFTPVSTTELAQAAFLKGEFDKRGVKVIVLSLDSVQNHRDWIEDIKKFGRVNQFVYPIIGDINRELAVKFGMVEPDEKDKPDPPPSARGVFVIGPDKKLKLYTFYPATTGANFNELLRVIDSLQLTANKKVATPADWKNGGDCMVPLTVKSEEFPRLFPKGVTTVELKSGRKYLRFTPQP